MGRIYSNRTVKMSCISSTAGRGSLSSVSRCLIVQRVMFFTSLRVCRTVLSIFQMIL